MAVVNPPRGFSRALDAVDADEAIRASIVTPAADLLPALFINRDLPVVRDHHEESHTYASILPT